MLCSFRFIFFIIFSASVFPLMGLPVFTSSPSKQPNTTTKRLPCGEALGETNV